MALGRDRHGRRKSVPPKLMLTSMMDMFTIILIFLLFSFSESPEKLKLDKNLELPRSNTEAGYSQALKIVLTKTDLRVEDEPLAVVQDRRIVGLSPEDLTASTLYRHLKTHREKQTAEDPSSGAGPPHVLFLCDQSHSFKTINQVIKTAGVAGYPHFQFAVLEEKQVTQ
jgi:biopolymer transport protein ExbD